MKKIFVFLLAFICGGVLYAHTLTINFVNHDKNDSPFYFAYMDGLTGDDFLGAKKVKYGDTTTMYFNSDGDVRRSPYPGIGGKYPDGSEESFGPCISGGGNNIVLDNRKNYATITIETAHNPTALICSCSGDACAIYPITK